MQGWLSILIMIALGAGFALISVLLSSVLGPRKPTPEKSAPYECGMPAVEQIPMEITHLGSGIWS